MRAKQHAWQTLLSHRQGANGVHLPMFMLVISKVKRQMAAPSADPDATHAQSFHPIQRMRACQLLAHRQQVPAHPAYLLRLPPGHKMLYGARQQAACTSRHRNGRDERTATSTRIKMGLHT
jgi:hypothetical protein